MKYKLIFLFFTLSTFTIKSIFDIDSLYHCKSNNQELLTALNCDQQHLQKLINYVENKEKECVTGWQKSYYIVCDLVNDYNLKIGAEVGIAFGTQSIQILKDTNIEKLYSIDPHQYFPQSVYSNGMNFTQQHFELIHYNVQQRLKKFDNRSEIIRKTSLNAVKEFEDNSLDFVYIDDNHSYENVKAELHAWYTKVRLGGLLIGDDYGNLGHPGVKRAVDEFFANKKLSVSFPRKGKWLVIKPIER
jgi:hypothetical protein